MVSPKKRIWIALIPVAVLVAVLAMDTPYSAPIPSWALRRGRPLRKF